MKKILLLGLPLLFLVVSCKNVELYHKGVRMVKVSELSSAKVSDSAVVALLAEKLGVRTRIFYTLSEDTALLYLHERKADLAIIPNNVHVRDGSLRTVMPMLPRILVILAMNVDAGDRKNLKELFEKHTVVYEDLSRIDSIFFRTFFESIGVDFNRNHGLRVNSLDMSRWRDSSLVFAGLTHMHNPLVRRLLDEGAVLVSLDEVDLLGKGSMVDGVILNYPWAIPYILPKAFYKGHPEYPVLTVAIFDILVTRKDEPTALIYDLVKAIAGNKGHLVAMDHVYNLLQVSGFEDEMFSFPLHEGTLEYLNRDEPSLISRYAAFLWPLISILAILAGAFASIRRWMSLRKKLSIESFYRRLLSIRKKALRVENVKARKKLINDLRQLRSEAFDVLMENRLVADDSFQIFLILYSEVFDEISK